MDRKEIREWVKAILWATLILSTILGLFWAIPFAVHMTQMIGVVQW